MGRTISCITVSNHVAANACLLATAGLGVAVIATASTPVVIVFGKAITGLSGGGLITFNTWGYCRSRIVESLTRAANTITGDVRSTEMTAIAIVDTANAIGAEIEGKGQQQGKKKLRSNRILMRSPLM